MKGEARLVIAAPADRLWAMVTDVTRMPEWSPETYRASWLGGATGPAVGAKFRGWNRHGVLRWFTNPKVVACEPGRVFAFDTGSTTWRYEFKPVDGEAGAGAGAGGAGAGGSTEVVESFETRQLPGYDFVLRAMKRDKQLEAGALETLHRLKKAAESEGGA